MKIVLIQEAFEELNDAVLYYEDQQKGLGIKLKEEVDHYMNWILNNPDVPKVRKNEYRRVNLSIFPYYIAYIIRGETLWIVAFAHAHRKPEYWIKRKRQMR